MSKDRLYINTVTLAAALGFGFVAFLQPGTPRRYLFLGTLVSTFLLIH